MTQVDFYDKEQVDTLLATKADDSEVESIAADVGTSADDPSATGSIWARLKYILVHWMTTDSEQTVSAKKTFSVSPEVPTTPATPASAVNSAHVNDATDGANNLVHKDGGDIQTITMKTLFPTFSEFRKVNVANNTSTPANLVTHDIFYRNTDNTQNLAVIRFQINTANKRSLLIGIWNPTANDFVWTELGSVTP